MTHDELLKRISAHPRVNGGQPSILGTRICISIILDGLAEGLTPDELISHYPQLSADDIRAALAYAAELARENIWKVSAEARGPNQSAAAGRESKASR